jgi:hypothetical protein
MRTAAAALLLLAAVAAHGADTTEAARVAAWVRALPPAELDTSLFGVLGGISTNHIGPHADYVRANGPKALYADSVRLASARAMLAQRGTYVAALGAGGIRWFRDVQNMPWGLIEVERDRFQWELIDTIVQTAQSNGARYVGTVMPYAGWELRAAGYAATTDSQCQRLFTEDVFYLTFDQRMDRYKDEAEYLRFLGRAVERYDGDGVDDMPGLTAPVKFWQIHNEPEGNHCGLFRDDPAAFARLMRVSYEAIHASCADCMVLNGGAAFPLWRESQTPTLGGATFWRDFVAAGGAAYVDVIAVHYNQGKDPDHGNVDDLEFQIRRIRELLGSTKPVWITEYGVVIGTTLGNFSGLTEAAAAAWYLRMDAAALAAGASRFFPDATSLVEMNGTTYLPFYVQKLIQAKLGGFTSATKVAAGQYRFRVNGVDRWVVWSGMPVTGIVKATDMYGNETVADASTLRATEAAPLIVERVAKRRAL